MGWPGRKDLSYLAAIDQIARKDTEIERLRAALNTLYTTTQGRHYRRSVIIAALGNEPPAPTAGQE